MCAAGLLGLVESKRGPKIFYYFVIKPRVIMGLLLTTYWGAGIYAKPFDFCYVHGKTGDSKSFDMQTIYAITKGN